MGFVRCASVAICVIVIASFLTFAANQAKSASTHQQEQLAGPAQVVEAGGSQPRHESAVHRALDEVAGELTSPFSGIVSGTAGEWEVRSLKLLAALLVYGFGLGYLARTLRVGL